MPKSWYHSIRNSTYIIVVCSASLLQSCYRTEMDSDQAIGQVLVTKLPLVLVDGCDTAACLASYHDQGIKSRWIHSGPSERICGSNYSESKISIISTEHKIKILERFTVTSLFKLFAPVNIGYLVELENLSKAMLSFETVNTLSAIGGEISVLNPEGYIMYELTEALDKGVVRFPFDFDSDRIQEHMALQAILPRFLLRKLVMGFDGLVDNFQNVTKNRNIKIVELQKENKRIIVEVNAEGFGFLMTYQCRLYGSRSVQKPGRK